MIYTVHVPRDTYDTVAAAERARYMRDGFSWGALVFGPLWLLWHRAWLSALAYLVAASTLYLIQKGLSLGPDMLGPVLFLLAVFMGFEGPSLVRWSMDRRHYRCVEIISATSREDAERQFLNTWRPRQISAKSGCSPIPERGPTFGLFSDEAL